MAQCPITRPLPSKRRWRPVAPTRPQRLVTESACLQFARNYGLHVVCARPFNHIGPGQAPTFAIPSFARQLVEARNGGHAATLLVGNLEPVRDFYPRSRCGQLRIASCCCCKARFRPGSTTCVADTGRTDSEHARRPRRLGRRIRRHPNRPLQAPPYRHPLSDWRCDEAAGARMGAAPDRQRRSDRPAAPKHHEAAPACPPFSVSALRRGSGSWTANPQVPTLPPDTL